MVNRPINQIQMKDRLAALPKLLACGTIKETRTCTGPLNFGKECPRIDGTLTTASDRTETRDCLGVPTC